MPIQRSFWISANVSAVAVHERLTLNCSRCSEPRACSRTISFLPPLPSATRTIMSLLPYADVYLCICTLPQLHACSSELLDICEHQRGCGPGTSDPQLRSALLTGACSRTMSFLPTLPSATCTAVSIFLCSDNCLCVCTFPQLHECSSELLDVCEQQRGCGLGTTDLQLQSAL